MDVRTPAFLVLLIVWSRDHRQVLVDVRREAAFAEQTRDGFYIVGLSFSRPGWSLKVFLLHNLNQVLAFDGKCASIVGVLTRLTVVIGRLVLIERLLGIDDHLVLGRRCRSKRVQHVDVPLILLAQHVMNALAVRVEHFSVVPVDLEL